MRAWARAMYELALKESNTQRIVEVSTGPGRMQAGPSRAGPNDFLIR